MNQISSLFRKMKYPSNFFKDSFGEPYQQADLFLEPAICRPSFE